MYHYQHDRNGADGKEPGWVILQQSGPSFRYRSGYSTKYSRYAWDGREEEEEEEEKEERAIGPIQPRFINLRFEHPNITIIGHGQIPPPNSSVVTTMNTPLTTIPNTPYQY